MGEYLAPGVYVEEVTYAPRRIEAVDPSVTGLVGTAAAGPVDEIVEVRSAADAEPLGDSWLGRAARDFLANGGRRALVVRASTTSAGLDVLAGSDVQLLVVEHDPAVAHAWCVEHRVFLVVDAEAGGDVPAGLGPNAAAYFPRLVGPGLTTRPCAPSVAGVVARTDRERGVWEAPAGMDAVIASEPAEALQAGTLSDLAARGVNPLRVLDGRAVVWGARTTAPQDPEWRYVSVRRTVLVLEVSIERGLQWVAFEPNGPSLWTQVRASVENLLDQWWRMGALVGTKPDEAYFVRCDQSTMTQTDLADGRLVCEVGLALVRPAELVVLRVEQRTARV